MLNGQSSRVYGLCAMVCLLFVLNGCFSIPVFMNAPPPAGEKHINALISSQWRAQDSSQNLLVFFTRTSSGDITAFFRKSSIVDGRLEQENTPMKAVVSCLGNNNLLFLSHIHSSGEGTKEDEQSLQNDKGYIAFCYTIEKDFLTLTLLSGSRIGQLVREGLLAGKAPEKDQNGEVVVMSDSKELSKVLAPLETEKLIGVNPDDNMVKRFRRKGAK